MGRTHKKVTGFHPVILQKTNVENLDKNFLLQTVNTKKKPINYVIPSHLLRTYMQKLLEYIAIAGEITHKEATDLLFKDIYSVYKKKVATVRIPLLLLNMLVKEEILYSDNSEDYFLVQSQEKAKEWLENTFDKK